MAAPLLSSLIETSRASGRNTRIKTSSRKRCGPRMRNGSGCAPCRNARSSSVIRMEMSNCFIGAQGILIKVASASSRCLRKHWHDANGISGPAAHDHDFRVTSFCHSEQSRGISYYLPVKIPDVSTLLDMIEKYCAARVQFLDLHHDKSIRFGALHWHDE